MYVFDKTLVMYFNKQITLTIKLVVTKIIVIRATDDMEWQLQNTISSIYK